MLAVWLGLMAGYASCLFVYADLLAIPVSPRGYAAYAGFL
jgi:hypothetical protein